MRLWLVTAAALAAGCGYVGEPLPPLLNIPSRVTDLKARQVGGQIHIEFTIPPLNTEGEILKNLERIDLRVGAFEGAEFSVDAWAAGAQPVEASAGEQGAVRATVSAAPWTGKEAIVGVELVARNGRRSGWSNLAAVAIVAPPAVPAAVKAENVREGVRVTWLAAAPRFRVFRQAPGEKEFTPVGESETAGFVDRAAEYGKTYRYKVRSVVTTSTGEAVGEYSAEADITPEDRFPPPPPSGLTAIASTASVELVWEAAPEAASYRVYRASGGGPAAKLADVAAGFSYSDRGVTSGNTYSYTVSSVDAAGNESAPSAPVEITTL